MTEISELYDIYTISDYVYITLIAKKIEKSNCFLASSSQ